MNKHMAVGMSFLNSGVSRGLFKSVAVLCLLLGALLPEVQAAGKTDTVDMKKFTPKVELNKYWMYMDSTLYTGTQFATAGQGKVGVGDFVMGGSNTDSFHTPTFVRGEFKGGGPSFVFDSSLYVHGNATFRATTFRGLTSKVIVDGNLDYSNNGGEDSAETWVGGNVAFRQNSNFRNKFHFNGTYTLDKPVKFDSAIYYNGTKNPNPITVLSDLTNKAVAATYVSPLPDSVFFDSSKFPGYGMAFALPASPEYIDQNYASSVCGVSVACNGYPGLGYGAKSIAPTKYLPPGYYGDLNVNGGMVVLGEGFYYFNSVNLQNGGKLIGYQPTGDRTIVYSLKGYSTSANDYFIGADSGYIASKFGVTASADDFGGGTMMLVAGPGANFDLSGSNSSVWATLSAPTGKITMNSQMKLFGQMFARHFSVANQFSGGQGMYIPFYPDPPLISFDVAVFSSKVAEPDLRLDGKPDTVIARFPLKMSHINGQAVTIYYHTENITATAGGLTSQGLNDYVEVKSGSVVIPATYDTASILIKVLGDVVYEGNETYKVVLDKVVNGTLGHNASDSMGIGTIVDNENPLKVRLVADGATTMVRPWLADSAFHFQLQTIDPGSKKNIPTLAPVTVKLKVTAVSNATASADFTLPVATYYIAIGDSVTSVRVTIPKSDLFGPDRVFKLEIDSVYGATKSDSIVYDTLVSPAAALTVRDASANQATSTTLALPVQLVRLADKAVIKSSVPLSYTWQTKDSTAKADVHYKAVAAGTAGTFPAYTLTDSVRVTLIRNALIDSTRYLKAVLTPVPGTLTRLSGKNDTGIGAILNGWPKPRIQMDDVSIQRRTSDFVFKFPVSLSQASAFGISYSFAAVNGGAINGSDYVLALGSHLITGTDSIAITIKASKQFDSSRSFYVIIPTWDTSRIATVAEGSDTVAKITLTNAITGARLLVDDAAADQSTQSQIRFPVRLVDAAGATVSSRIALPYSYSTIDGSARGGTHFTAATNRPDTLAAGGLSDTISIALIRTAKFDTTRHFQVDLAPTSGIAGLSNAHDSAVGTLINGYALPVIHIDSASILRPTVKTALDFKVWLDRASAIDLPFTWATREGSAKAGIDYVDVPAGSASIRDSLKLQVWVFSLPGVYDTVRHFHVDLKNLASFQVGNSTAPGRIDPVMGLPYLKVRPAGVSDPGVLGKDTALYFKVELQDSLGNQVTSRLSTSFVWSTKDSTAHSISYVENGITYPADFLAVVNGAASIPADSLSGVVRVKVLGNALAQPDRQLRALISSAVNARLDAASSNLGTIFDSTKSLAYFPNAKTPVQEVDHIVWLPVQLTQPVADVETLTVSVDAKSTGLPGKNFDLLQAADNGRDTVAAGSKASSVTIVFPAGSTQAWVAVQVRRDSVRTNDLKVFLNLTMANAKAKFVKVDPTQAQAELDIVNADPAPYLGFRDTVLSTVRGTSLKLRVGIRPFPSDKDPSAQYAGTVSDTAGNSSLAWGRFVSSAASGSTPAFAQRRLDTTMDFATVNDGRDGPAVRAVLRLKDWTPGEAFKPLAGDTVLHDSVVVWITNGNAPSKVAFPSSTLTVNDNDGQATIQLLLDRASYWTTSGKVKATGTPSSVLLAADSSVTLSFAPGDTIASFILRFGNDHKVGKDREFDLHLSDLIHLLPGQDSVLHVRIVNTNLGPKVKITSPSEGAVLGKKDLDSTGAVTVRWNVDGKVQAPYDTLIPEGRSTLLKCFLDEWGNPGCDSVHVTLDTTAPIVVIDSISRDGKTWTAVKDTPWVNVPGIQVKWHSVDNGVITRHTDSEKLLDTLNAVVRCAEDAVGNKGCGTGLVGLDTDPPKVWIVTPPEGSHWPVGCVATQWMEQDGSKVTRHDTTICFDHTGPATIFVKSSPDRAGNVGSASTSIVVDPNVPTSAEYLDTDGDGRIDAVVMHFPTQWNGTLPTVDISYGGEGQNTRKDQTTSYGTVTVVGNVVVVKGDTLKDAAGKPIRAVPGTPVITSDGSQLVDASGKPVYQSVGNVPLLDKDGKAVLDANGVPLWQVTRTQGTVDSSVLVVKLSEPYPYGWTSSSYFGLGVLKATETYKDSTGAVVSKIWNSSFNIGDKVAPVIVKSEVHRTEDYNGVDTVWVYPSEAVSFKQFDGTGIFQVSYDGKTWVDVKVQGLSPTGAIVFTVQPGEAGSVRPGMLIRFDTGLVDAFGNKTGTNAQPSVVVQGPLRPELMQVTLPSGLVTATPQSMSSKLPGGFTFLASQNDTANLTSYVPGQGYGSPSATSSVCPVREACVATSIYVNKPASFEIFIYDHMGTFVLSQSFRLTAADLATIQKDKLDRTRLQALWNLRDSNGRHVITGIYLMRVVIRGELNNPGGASLENHVLRVGVKIL